MNKEQIIKEIEIVSKWFTDKSGDNLAAVFESFSGAAGNGVEPRVDGESKVNENGELKIDDHYYNGLNANFGRCTRPFHGRI